LRKSWIRAPFEPVEDIFGNNELHILDQVLDIISSHHGFLALHLGVIFSHIMDTIEE
jgi:hypothetical protein